MQNQISWKTTATAILLLISTIAAASKNFIDSGAIDGTQVSLLITQVLTVIGLLFAKDSGTK